MKVDVCILTKQKAVNLRNLEENVPVNAVIIERSEPLGWARMRAIQKVETEWFAFVDDDVELSETWFDTIIHYTNEDVGAVQGIMATRGLGEKWDKEVSASLKSEGIKELRLGDRGYTHNTLIRTKLVKDWKPSRNDLSAWEDYEITQHILRKGYKWITVPAKAYHIVSWIDRLKNSVWSMQSWKKINSRKSWPRSLIGHAVYMLYLLVDWHSLNMHWRVRIYFFYTSLGCIWGLLK